MDNERHFENEEFGVSFSLPEKITVRQQLVIRERVWGSNNADPASIRFWFSMLPMVEDWDCDDYPDPADIDIDALDDTRATDIILWASARMADYFMDRGFVPKNE